MGKLKRLILAIFMPKRCPYCDAVIKFNETACCDCAGIIKPDTYERYTSGGYKCVSPFPYKGVYKQALLSFKFKKHFDVAESLAAPLADCIRKSYKDISFDCVTCVPMHEHQLRKRGKNQSELLARELCFLLGLPYKNLLSKTKENQPQHHLTQRERRDNVKGVYKSADTDQFIGDTVLLIDDVLTTGYTLGECCKVLAKAGIKHIYCATLCCAIK